MMIRRRPLRAGRDIITSVFENFLHERVRVDYYIDMKNLFSLGFLAVLLAVGNLSAEEVVVIDAGDLAVLKEKQDTEVTVEGVVSKIENGHNKKIVSLGTDDQRNGFAIMISDPDLLNFPDGLEKYQGQKIRVFGRLLKQGDQPPRMRIKSPEAITIVES